jgi:4-hydroxy-tetrahydrodipicolinate reductase
MSESVIKVTICGAAGRMGTSNLDVFSNSPDVQIVGAIEAAGSSYLDEDAGTVAGLGSIGVPIVDELQKVMEETNVVIDFTNPRSTLEHVRVAKEFGKAVVIGTTGLSEEDLDLIREYTKVIPIVLSPNMSLGINALFHLVRQAAALLGEDFDVEIFEIHHKLKKDSPSGTALQFGRIIAETRDRTLNEVAVYGREGFVGERKKGEIGIMALRMADIVGDHSIIFGGMGERVEFTHRSSSRKNYSYGALRAVKFVSGKNKGFYTMADVLGISSFIPTG